MQGTKPERDREDYLTPDSSIALRVFMAVCPQGHPPTAPHPALPYLKGYLGQVLPETQVTSKDLNAICYAYVFSPEQLAKHFSPEDAQRIREAYEAQKDAATYADIPRFIENHGTLEQAFDGISTKHRETHNLEKETLRLRGNTFTYISERPSNSRESIVTSIEQMPETNIFYRFYMEKVIPAIKKGNYDVVGLSVFLTDQVLPTFLLASLIKKECPDTKVVIGGNYLTRFVDVLSQDDELNRQLLNYADAIIVKEGEVPFRKLLEAVARSESFDGINQLITKDSDGKVSSTYNQRSLVAIDMDELARPDFEGIFTDLDDEEFVFWTPKPVISLYTQRGCPFAGGCDFCTIMSGNNRPNSKMRRSIGKVAEDIEYYQKRYGTQYFSFGNETLSKDFMVGLADELDGKDLTATIDGYARTDSFTANGNVDHEAIKKIGKYFRFLQIGVESSDEATLDSMHKGRKPVKDSEIVKALFENGTYPHAFLMTGFPPERKEYEGKPREDYINFYMHSALATLRWLQGNAPYIGTHKATALFIPRDNDGKMLVRDSTGTKIAPRFGHEIALGEARDLEFNVPYRKVHGSRDLDAAVNALFDCIATPFGAFTHNTIYHQRLFNWGKGIEWSRTHPEQADTVAAANEANGRRILQEVWKHAAGREYVHARQELARKGGMGRDKRAALEAIIAEVRKKNKLIGVFPDGIPSLEAFINFDG